MCRRMYLAGMYSRLVWIKLSISIKFGGTVFCIENYVFCDSFIVIALGNHLQVLIYEFG